MFKKALATIAFSAVALMAGEKINGAGATFPAPVYYAWAKAYESTGNQVNYQSIGSSGGIKQMKAGTVDFGGTDEAQNIETLKKEGWYQFPSVIGSIVLAHNVSGVGDNELKLSNEAVAGIFLGKITKWNDQLITKENPNLKLPDEPITVVHRSDGSGTTYHFSEWLSAISKEWKEKVGVGKALSWPVGIGGKGNEGVSNLVKQTPYSIGYVELSYKNSQGFPAALVQSKTGKYVAANAETIRNAAKFAQWDPSKGFEQLLILQPGDDTYPIVAPTFILVSAKNLEVSKKAVAFFDFAFTNGDKLAEDLGYVALPKETKELIRKYWKENKLQ